MARYFLASVGTAEGFDGKGNKILDAKALTQNGFNISTSKEEVRGGQGAGLHGQYFHTSQFGVTLQDALADLNYFALQVGGQITKGGNVFTNEQVVVTGNAITVEGTPVDFGGYGIVGWWRKVGEDSTQLCTFKGKKATLSGVEEGDVVCVRYVEKDNTARAFEVSTAYIPAEIHLVITMPMFNASVKDGGVQSTNSQVGEYIIDIPRFQFNGSIDMSTAMANASNIDIGGMALQSGVSGCSGKGIYATITERVFNSDPFDNVYTIVVEDSNIELTAPETQILRVMALYNDNTCPSLIDNKDLTFNIASGGQSYASVDMSGEVTASSTGTATVEISVTSKPSLTARATVTVTE